MKSPVKKTNKTPKPESRRRRLQKLLKQILAGEASIHAGAEIFQVPAVRSPYRIVE